MNLFGLREKGSILFHHSSDFIFDGRLRGEKKKERKKEKKKEKKKKKNGQKIEDGKKERGKRWHQEGRANEKEER